MDDGYSADELEAFCLNGDTEEQLWAVGLSGTPTPAAESLVAHSDERIRGALAQRPDISERVARILINDRSTAVRMMAAGNTCISPVLLAHAVKDSNEWVRQTAASNRSLPEATIRAVAKIPELEYNVATNPSTPTDVLEDLSRSRSDNVREQVAVHPSTSAEAAGRLLVEAVRTANTAAIERAAAAHPPEVVAAVIALHPSYRGARAAELLEIARATVCTP